MKQLQLGISVTIVLFHKIVLGISMEFLDGPSFCFFIMGNNFDLDIFTECEGGTMLPKDNSGSLDPEVRYI